MVDLVRLKKFEDERGLLVVQESEVPFVIKRTFWIYGKKNELRGGHGHFRTKLALIAITGSIDIDVASKKKSENIYVGCA